MDIINSFLDPLKQIIPHLPTAMLNFVVGAVAISIVMLVIRHSMRLLKVPHDYRGLVITISKFALWLILLVFVLNSLGFGDLAVIISGSAVVLVFFLNNSIGPLLNNLVSGFYLLGDPDFRVGMHVNVNEGKTEGIVHGIDMRKVRVIDKDGKMHVVPNSLVENTEWVIVDRSPKK